MSPVFISVPGKAFMKMVLIFVPHHGNRQNVRYPYIGKNCRLVETGDSDHVIHTVHSNVFIEAMNSLAR